jgi:hypothetical protein
MLKFLIIFGLIVYVLYKFASLFFRAGANSQQFRNPNQHQYKPRNGNVNVDTPPKQKGTDFMGGEYVDYEEVK